MIGVEKKCLQTWAVFRNQEAVSVQVLLVALKACSKTQNLERGKQLHAEAAKSGHDCNIYVATALINMYAKCGCMLYAHEVFDGMKHPTVVSWTALILGYADNGEGQNALDLFSEMITEGVVPDCVTFVAALKACTSLAVKEKNTRWVESTKAIHNVAIENNNSDVYVENTLIDTYAKCGNMIDARHVFNSMQHRTVVSWTALILGYADNGEGHTSLDLFTRMKTEGPPLNSVTLVAAIKACSSLRWLECQVRGKGVHNIIIENGNSDVYLQNTLIDMYSKCGRMVEAHQVFNSVKHPDAVSWNALILGYADNGEGHTALDLFTRMRTDGLVPNSGTIVASLKACVSIAVNQRASRADCRDRGKEIQNFALENDCSLDPHVQNTLLDMYSKCGSMTDAREVFDSMEHQTVVSWTALISGYAENAQGHTALDLFRRMRLDGPLPDSVTLEAAFKACGLVGALEFGRAIHSEISEGYDFGIVLVNCLVDFYAKCGSLVEAQSVFDLHADKRDVITWNALLSGFSSRGDDETVFRLFQRMQDSSRPNGVTFLCILMCCSHVGLVEKGKNCFDAMSTNYGTIPTVEHYNCMVDIFARANRLHDALALLERMPYCPTVVHWMTILGACRKWNNVEMGRLAFRSLIDLNDKDPAAYVLMGQIYGSKSMFQEQEKVMAFREKLEKTKSESY